MHKLFLSLFLGALPAAYGAQQSMLSKNCAKLKEKIRINSTAVQLTVRTTVELLNNKANGGDLKAPIALLEFKILLKNPNTCITDEVGKRVLLEAGLIISNGSMHPVVKKALEAEDTFL